VSSSPSFTAGNVGITHVLCRVNFVKNVARKLGKIEMEDEAVICTSRERCLEREYSLHDKKENQDMTRELRCRIPVEEATNSLKT